MFLISGGIVILLFVFLIIFAFPQFSPIPYYPSNYQDKNRLLKSLNLKNNQLVIDLGAGDGWVIFAAASTAYQQKLNTQFIAAEINPFLILLLYVKRFLHPNKKNITIKFFNILKMIINP
jgi:tRNA G46 methylase TrmB